SQPAKAGFVMADPHFNRGLEYSLVTRHGTGVARPSAAGRSAANRVSANIMVVRRSADLPVGVRESDDVAPTFRSASSRRVGKSPRIMASRSDRRARQRRPRV